LRRAVIEKGIHKREFVHVTSWHGNGIAFGSTIRTISHIDLVVRHPIVEVDGKGVLKDRYVLFERSRTLTSLHEIRKRINLNAICDNG